MPATPRTPQQQKQRRQKQVKTATAVATYRYRKEGARAANELFKRDRHYAKRVAKAGPKAGAKMVKNDATKAAVKKVADTKRGAAIKASTGAMAYGNAKASTKRAAGGAKRAASKTAYVAKTHPKATVAVGLGVAATAYVGHKAYQKRQHKYSSARPRGKR